jgi:hypothetical protein
VNAKDLAARLAGVRAEFEAALSDVEAVDAAELLPLLIERLDESPMLSSVEREKRLYLVLSRTQPSEREHELLAVAASAVESAALRNAVLQVLPTQYQRLVYLQGYASPAAAAAADAAKSWLDGTEITPIKTPDPVNQVSGQFADVVILSLNADPATNKLLEGAGFVPLRSSSREELDRLLATNEICGFLVDSSFLRAVGDQQADVLRQLAECSTFTFTRIQEDDLYASTPEVATLFSQTHCSVGPPTVEQLSFRDRSELQERELPNLIEARERLTVTSTGIFVPAELSEAEFRLLAAAMKRYAKARSFDPRAELTSARTAFMQGGAAGARVVLVKVDYLRYPVVVKVDSKSSILEEARRFLTFIQAHNQELRPEVHLHGDAALIIFDVIANSDVSHVIPAPTLASELDAYWFSEMKDPETHGNDAALVAAVRNAAERLAVVNILHNSDASFECRANPYVKGVRDMEDHGFNWGFTEAMRLHRDRCQSLLDEHKTVAVCHGDAHTRNVLVRGQQGYLIDYAYSGPGHPCADLTRLELAVFFSFFHPFGSEERVVELQRDLSTEGVGSQVLEQRYPDLCRSRSNRLCISLCTTVRDQVRAVLGAHGLDWKDYRATKVLSAWQALQVPTLQQSLVRSVIFALSEE